MKLLYPMKPIKLFEMFAGYGGAHFAFKRAGIPVDCVGISEIKKIAIETYNINHPNIKNFGNCTTINPLDIPSFDILTAGFPCQDVSLAGKNNLSCNRTRLIEEVFRITNIKKPKIILLENVKGLLQNKHKEFFKYIISSLNKLGYYINYACLNSRDYNTPQNRERIYFVCIRKDINVNFEFPLKETLVNDWHNYIDKKNNLKKANKTPSRDKMRIKCKNITNAQYSSCITLKQDRFPNAGIIDFEDYYRFLTPVECFRLQGFFNDEIKINHLSTTRAYNMAGDGWDINVVSKILLNIFGNCCMS
jgi:DNA (cytosine-5)-methyltransferase 1